MNLSLGAAGLALLLAAGGLAAAPATADAGPDADQDSSRLVVLDVPSPLIDTGTLGGTLKYPDAGLQVRVLLPAGYDDHPDQDYPVLYLLHGANGSSRDYVDQLDVTHLLAGLPAIVVMPDGGTYGMYTNWWDKGGFAGPDWTDYELDTVRSRIEQDFRIRRGRRWHAIAGISMGGQGALRLGSVLPGYFGSVVGLSPAIADMRSAIAYAGMPILLAANGSGLVTYEDIWGPPTGWYAKANNPKDLVGNLADSRLYLASGNGLNCFGDPLSKTFALDAVTEAGIRTFANPYAAGARGIGADVTERRTCGVHTWPVWTRDLQAILSAWDLFSPVPADPTSWTYRTGMQHGSMWQFDYSFTGARGFDTFTRAGRTISATGSGTVTLSTDGCTFTMTLPASRTLPSGCQLRMME